MRLKQLVALACSTAVLAPIPTVAANPQQQSTRYVPLPPQQREFCRVPEALPQLGEERQWSNQQQPCRNPRDGRTTSSCNRPAVGIGRCGGFD
jgi:hypothetical protein